MTALRTKFRYLAAGVMAAGVLLLPLQAQDDKPLVIGGFDNSGSMTFGYRFTDVSGYQAGVSGVVRSRSGPRLLDFSLFGHVSKGKKSFLDDYSVVANGIGGDPWSTIQVNVRKKKLYDLRFNLRQSHYYWNQNDGAALPNGLMGLTSNHDWATVRRFADVNLVIHARNNLRFNFEYSHNARHGVNDTTRTMAVFRCASGIQLLPPRQPLLPCGIVE